MGILWFIAGLVTLYLAQKFYTWQKPLNLPWYAWLVTALAYASAWLFVATIITLSGEVARYGSKPMLISGLIVLLITVALAAIARWLINREKSKGTGAAAAA